MVKNIKKIGLIKGRHELPVEEYIINSEITSELLAHNSFDKLKELVKAEVNKFCKKYKSREVDLYLTGLSRIQHLVLMEFTKCGYIVNMYDYDLRNNIYFKIN